jgi:hypothetical protein
VVLGSEIPESKDKGTPEGKRDAIKQEHALDTFVGKLEHHSILEREMGRCRYLLS